MLEYKTGRLPVNFIILGILSGGVGLWMFVLSDWIAGVVFIVKKNSGIFAV